MREEPLPQVLRPRRQALGETFGLDDPQATDEAAELIPDIDFAPHPHAQPPFMLDIGSTYHLHIAAVEFRRQARLRELARQRETLVLAAMGLPLLAMLLKLLWSSFTGSRWWANDSGTPAWQGFVGGDW
ncbi:hypothetical protein J7T55_013320 [Diaporthe amygdali]|uniref:uncharacterized protein n=1 Tax=Phomopsis amygdali TaxID=1214568 RepID=UPI0022FE88D0|nr:uncharacterized protein J7T55_013320 [Diaporthe amygdali]KAJ0119085.1 hypothetical protein J7T55_013320 [Diaporthe amygdali]